MPLILRDHSDHSGPLFRSIVRALDILGIQAAVTHVDADPLTGAPPFVVVGENIRAHVEMREAPSADMRFDAVEIPIFVVEGLQPINSEDPHGPCEWAVINKAEDPCTSIVTVILMLQETMPREARSTSTPTSGNTVRKQAILLL